MQIVMQGDEGFMAHLSMSQQALQRFSPLKPTRICVSGLCSPDRRRVEQFIEQKFRASYGAEIHCHYPMLMSVHGSDNSILAALGFRYAADAPLFLEQYLDLPVEKALSNAYGMKVHRGEVAEVGNLASSGQGGSIFLFTALNAYLAGQGVRINTVTATDFLYRYFRTLGFKATELGMADQSRLADGGKSWGSYYRENPRVIAGNINQVLARLRRHLKVVLETESLPPMHARLHTISSSEDLPRV